MDSLKVPLQQPMRFWDTADRGKGVPSFDEMMDIALVAVDFDDLTTTCTMLRLSNR